MKRQNRHSGFKQRQAKKEKEAEQNAMKGSLLKWVHKPEGFDGVDEDGASHEQQFEGEGLPPNVTEQPKKGDNEQIDTEEHHYATLAPQSEEHDRPAESDNLDVFNDVSVWRIPVPDSIRTDIIKQGSEPFQNREGPFKSVTRPGANVKGESRQLSAGWFYYSLANGDKVLRSWMAYSLLTGKLYCFCCRLFAKDDKSPGTSAFVTGFEVWWKLNPKLYEHEQSKDHLSCLEKWKTLSSGLHLQTTIDSVHISQMEKEKKRFRDILHRILDVILFLSRQNLSFRGHREDASSANRGNFLELVELLSHYDAVLKEHLVRFQQSKDNRMMSSYMSPQTQNEFISLLANHVNKKLVSDIKEARYFGILFDSTPDVSHSDQMSTVIRYVHIISGTVEVRESFLGFFCLKGKTAVALTGDILGKLESEGLDIQLCRGQGYDNAASMAGIHGGVQQKIKAINPKAVFVPCSNHSLNLCGKHSFSCNPSCVTFFGSLEAMYTFFALSTHRWDVLVEHTGLTVKRLSTTRWSAHADAIKPVLEKFDKFVEAIEALCGVEECDETRGAAHNLLPAVCDFSFICFLFFWGDILQEVNLTQKYMQGAGVTLDMITTKIKSLQIFLEERRMSLADNAVRQALSKCLELGISTEKRTRRRKKMPGEEANDAGLSLQQETKKSMLECLDRFQMELETRGRAMKDILHTFCAIQPVPLISASDEEVRSTVARLAAVYDELSNEDLRMEIPRLRRHLQAAEISLEEAQHWTALQVLQFIIKWDFVESLPNLTLALKFFLTICVSVASCERSFSKMKLIKNYLRSTMSQSRLSDLAVLSIENDMTRQLDFDAVIDHFATLKTRRHSF
jgi:hypothetical protein